MKRNILYTGLIAATTLLTLGSCYDLDEMNRDPYGVEDTDKGGEITPEGLPTRNMQISTSTIV